MKSSLRKRYNLRLKIYACGDDIHAKAWWYTIAFAMDKQKGHRMVLVRNGTRTQVNAYGIDLSSLSNGNEVDSEEYWGDKLVTVSAKPVSQTNKKGHQMVSFFVGARNGTWTRTVKPHAPQTCASASSATLANDDIILHCVPFVNTFSEKNPKKYAFF